MSSKIAFIDFWPVDRTKALALSRQYESMEEVVERVNRWIDEHGIEVLHIETLLSPGAPTQAGASPTYTEVNVGALGLAQWSQMIRVWYRRPRI